MMELVESGMPGTPSVAPKYISQSHWILLLVRACLLDCFLSHFCYYFRLYIQILAGKSSGASNNGQPSNMVQSHQILCCAYNANGTVFVTGSSDTLSRVCSVSLVYVVYNGHPCCSIFRTYLGALKMS